MKTAGTQSSEVAFDFPSARDAEFPTLVQIALMHYICNSRCLYCPVGLVKRGVLGQDRQGEFDPNRRCFFPFGLFGKIADEMAEHPSSILRLHGRGEPLLHPQYVEMIACAKKAGVGTVTSFTNAILLDERRSEEILNAGIDLLELSIDAYSEDLYHLLRGTNHFRQVVHNAEAFIRIRNRRSAATKTRVVVSAVDSPDFQPEKTLFREFWSERADMVIFRPYHTYGGRLRSLSACATPEPVPCAQLWTRFSVNPWGQVNACFNDWGDQEVVGSLTEPGASVASVWRGQRFESIRKASLERRAELKCCRTCLATLTSWTETYQVLLEKLRAAPPNTALN